MKTHRSKTKLRHAAPNGGKAIQTAEPNGGGASANHGTGSAGRFAETHMVMAKPNGGGANGTHGNSSGG